MKVHNRVRIPSPRDSSFTSLITRNSRKKVMEILALSSEFCSPFRPFGEGRGKKTGRMGTQPMQWLRNTHTHVHTHACTHAHVQIVLQLQICIRQNPIKIQPRSGKESEGHARVSSGFLGKKITWQRKTRTINVPGVLASNRDAALNRQITPLH